MYNLNAPRNGAHDAPPIGVEAEKVNNKRPAGVQIIIVYGFYSFSRLQR